MVEDHSDSMRGNLLLPHGLLFLNSNGFFIYPTDRIAHTIIFVIPVMEHWLEQDGNASSYGKEPTGSTLSD